jgi:hypothetical protein
MSSRELLHLAALRQLTHLSISGCFADRLDDYTVAVHTPPSIALPSLQHFAFSQPAEVAPAPHCPPAIENFNLSDELHRICGSKVGIDILEWRANLEDSQCSAAVPAAAEEFVLDDWLDRAISSDNDDGDDDDEAEEAEELEDADEPSVSDSESAVRQPASSRRGARRRRIVDDDSDDEEDGGGVDQDCEGDEAGEADASPADDSGSSSDCSRHSDVEDAHGAVFSDGQAEAGEAGAKVEEARGAATSAEADGDEC